MQNQPVIQTDAPAAWGSSGGPAVNARGDIVGVLTFVSLSPGAEGSIVQGFNFIIPADAVREFLKGGLSGWALAGLPLEPKPLGD